MKSLFLVLSHLGYAVSLVERGGFCAHWRPALTLFLIISSVLDYAYFCLRMRFSFIIKYRSFFEMNDQTE